MTAGCVLTALSGPNEAERRFSFNNTFIPGLTMVSMLPIRLKHLLVAALTFSNP
jgi:hypothetical protein